MELIEILNELGLEVNRKIDNLNCGGCCIFAAEVAKRMPIKFRILVGDPYHENNSITEIRRSISNNKVYDWNDNGLNFGHVFLEFEYEGEIYHYDSNGVNLPNAKSGTLRDPSFNFNVAEGELSLTEAITLARDKFGWNNMFNRDQIEKLRRIIRKHLS